jgi:hypothetical protein
VEVAWRSQGTTFSFPLPWLFLQWTINTASSLTVSDFRLHRVSKNRCVELAGGSQFSLELSDQKAQDFFVPTALKWQVLKHILKVFGEISVRI